MKHDAAIRDLLARALAWQEAHVTFDRAVADVPPELRGRQPEHLPYSPWQLLEHLRIAQRDILEFCRDADYRERTWPDDYWPRSAAPPSPAAWDRSIAQFKEDRAALEQIAAGQPDLEAKIPHGSGQTYLRELILVIDHTAYHVGQMVLLRRLLGNWG